MRQRFSQCALAVLLLLVVGGGGRAVPARATLEPHLGYGINVRDPDHLDGLVAPLGFEWVKLWEEYEDGWWPLERLPYRVLLAVSCAGFVGDPAGWADHVAQLAAEGQGRVEAYEVCNEPNLTHFWDDQPPDPARYVQMLCIAYEQIKAADPEAAVVSAGLAPVGRIRGTCNGWQGNDCGAMDERTYARAMLAQGAGACMDAFGYHPYGFAYEPERDPQAVENGFAFRGAEVMHDILLEYGLEDTPIWATEFNWLRDPAEDGPVPGWCHHIPEYEQNFGWMDVSEEDQADYLVRAFQYADDNWPWMHVMVVWNLDWHDYNWLCEPSRYFSIRRDDGSDPGAPTLAYSALMGMEKRPGPFAPRLKVEPDRLVFLADVDEPGTLVGVAAVRNVGYRTLAWAAEPDPGGEVVPVLPITAGVEEEPLWVQVDTAGMLTGTHFGAVTVTATATDVLGSPARLSLEVRVLPQVWRTFVPLMLRNR